MGCYQEAGFLVHYPETKWTFTDLCTSHGTTEVTADEKGARAGWPLCLVLNIAQWTSNAQAKCVPPYAKYECPRALAFLAGCFRKFWVGDDELAFTRGWFVATTLNGTICTQGLAIG